MNLEEPRFLNTDATQIIEDLKSHYENIVGFKLAPAQAEMFIINMMAYREQIIRVQANEAAKQNLLSFARYPMIDYLGELVGVKRLPSSSSSVELQFTLVGGHPLLTIPKGVRVQSVDGQCVFEILQAVKVLANETISPIVSARCTVIGEIGNYYTPGEIAVILDPHAYVLSASNISISSGGSNEESDDALRERIRLAPSSFSCAGPEDAYIYFAKSANASIIDVGVDSPLPGTVAVYPLLKDAAVPSQSILADVEAVLNAKKVRPLNDIVIVEAPETVNFDIEAEIILLDGAIEDVVIKQIQNNINDYTKLLMLKLGRDVVCSNLVRAMKVDGVYDVILLQPAENIILDKNQVAVCESQNITIIGSSDE